MITAEYLSRTPRETCGVFSAYSTDRNFNVSGIVNRGLLDLQHRGQEAAGIVTYGPCGHWQLRPPFFSNYREHRRAGLVSNVFDDEVLKRLAGNIGVGQVRYSTRGSHQNPRNFQPMKIEEGVYICFNGNIPNDEGYRERLSKEFHYRTTTDTETVGFEFIKGMKKYRNEFDAVKFLMEDLEGAYSVSMLYRDKVISFKAPNGIKPLCIGEMKLNGANVFVTASESCALLYPETLRWREVEPGEAAIFDGKTVKSERLVPSNLSACWFEYAYFSHPSSTFNGIEIRQARIGLGEELFRMYFENVLGSVKGPMPDSGRGAYMGFMMALLKELRDAYYSGNKQRFEMLLGELDPKLLNEPFVKNSAILRSFIIPEEAKRHGATGVKYKPVVSAISGNDVTTVDDTNVRGGTERRKNELLGWAGAKTKKALFSGPPIRHPCYLGIDFPESDELVAYGRTVEQVKEDVGSDFLGYVTIDGLERGIGLPKEKLCLGCVNGEYPLRQKPVERTREEIKR